MSAPMTPVRTRVTWIRWDKRRLCNVTSHPWVWIVTEPDGYERSFDTKREAQAWIDEYEALDELSMPTWSEREAREEVRAMIDAPEQDALL